LTPKPFLFALSDTETGESLAGSRERSAAGFVETLLAGPVIAGRSRTPLIESQALEQLN
jgi:hypothetical protein